MNTLQLVCLYANNLCTDLGFVRAWLIYKTLQPWAVTGCAQKVNIYSPASAEDEIQCSHAVSWYTGEAAEDDFADLIEGSEDDEEDDEDSDEEDDEDDEDEEEDEDDEGEEERKTKKVLKSLIRHLLFKLS